MMTGLQRQANARGYLHLRPSIMLRLARRARCVVTRALPFGSLVPGREGVAYEIVCPSHKAKVRLLDLLAWHDAKNDPGLRELALSLVRDVGGHPETLARAVHVLVRDGVHFIREPRETFQDAFTTLYLRAGDCDDHARAVAALARILHIPARLVTLSKRRDGRRLPTHVAVKLRPGRRWTWAETTVRGARWGEHPKAAKRRTGAAGRGDIPC